MNRTCIISIYDGAYYWSVLVDGHMIERDDKKKNPMHVNAEYLYWKNIADKQSCYSIDTRVDIYNKYGVDFIIVCDNGCIYIYTIDEDYALHEKYNF